MSSIDDRVVKMTFDNNSFEAKANTTLSTLDKLKRGLDFSGSKKSISELGREAGRFNLGSMATHIEGISAKFLAMSTIGVTALANITTKALDAGVALGKSLTIDPIAMGLQEYETNMNSIQTILANTQASGAGLKDVTGALDELNEYSDKTIYNFAEMARNIGTFTAAGVELNTATDSIKGIANLAALSGSSSEQASTAMYQLSQAISAGRVSLMDWNSVVNAGMGGAVFQRALAQTAEKMGTLEKGSVKLSGAMKNVTINGKSFRESISASGGKGGWLSSEVLTKTLSQFTGDLSNAELAAQGFSKAQIKAIQLQAKTAQDAATKVKTLKQTLNVAKETAQSGWAQTWRYVFGDFNEARGSFTELSNAINGVINKQADARNAILGTWKKLGGRNVAITALREAFSSLMSVLKPIKDAFREIFPRKTGKELFDLTVKIRNFFRGFKLGGEAAQNFKRTFKGIFAILSIGKMIVSGVVSTIFKLVKALAPAGGGILKLTGNLGLFFINLEKTLRNGTALTDFFDKLYDVLSKPIAIIASLGAALGGLFNKKETANVKRGASVVEDLGESLSLVEKILNAIKGAWESFSASFQSAVPGFQDFGNKIAEQFRNVGQSINDGLNSGNFDKVLSAIKVGLFGGLVAIIGKFVKDGLKLNFGQDDLFKRMGQTFDALTGHLKAMTLEVKSKALLNIAIALGVLAAAAWVLSKIDAADLAKSLGALSLMFTQLVVTMKVLTGTDGAVKLTAISMSLLLLAGAILILSAALRVLAGIEWTGLLKGLLSVAILLKLLASFTQSFEKDLPKLAGLGLSLILVAVALRLMANAVNALGNIDIWELVKGLTAVFVLLKGLGQAMSKMPTKGMFAAGAGIVLIAVGLNIMARAIEKIGNIDAMGLAKGVATIASVLFILAFAMKAMPKGLKGPAGLVLISFALGKIADVLGDLGNTDFVQLIKGILTLAIVLTVLAAAMVVMEAFKEGALAMIVAAAAVVVLAMALGELAKIDAVDLLKGLVAITLLFLIIGAAAVGFGYIAPLVIGLAISLALLGAGLAGIGFGALLFARAIETIINIAQMGAEKIKKAIDTAIEILPKLGEFAYKAIVEAAKALLMAAPALVEAGLELLLRFLTAIANAAPKIRVTLTKILRNLMQFLRDMIPEFVVTGAAIVLKIIRGLQSKLPAIIDEGATLLIAFIGGIARAYWRLITAAADLVLEFLNKIPPAIDKYSYEFGEAGGKIAVAIVKGMITGVNAGAAEVGNALRDLALSALDAAKNALGINSPSKEFIKIGKSVGEGFIIGIQGSRSQVKSQLDKLDKEIKNAITRTGNEITSLKARLKKLRSAKKPNVAEIRETEAALKEAIRLNRAATNAGKVFNKNLSDEKKRLISLGKDYERISANLKRRREELEEAKKVRDDYAKSLKEKYSEGPSIDPETKLSTYFDEMKKRIAANKKFEESLEKLRALGLSDEAYKLLLEKGIDAQPFIDQLLAGGQDAVDMMDELEGQLQESAQNIGEIASKELYQAAVDSAQGFVDGLEAELGRITKKMRALGKIIADAVKKELGIRSPSKVFAGIGLNVNRGFAAGLEKNTNVVDLAARRVAKNAVDAMGETIAGLSDIINTDIEIRPVIAPVLDLTGFKRSASTMDKMLQNGGIISTSVNSATAISAETQKALLEQLAEKQTASGDVTFIQNNNSPKALSETEIYRQTRNQLSMLKKGGG